MMADNVQPAEVLTCDWQPTGAFDRHGKPYKVCSRCGRGPRAFHRIAALFACGVKGSAAVIRGGVAAPTGATECTGCGEKSKAAKKKSKPVPADYPGAMVD